MAYEVEQKRSIGSRIGSALSGVGQAIGGAIDLNETLKHNELARQMAQQQLDQAHVDFQNKKAEMNDAAANQQGNIQMNILRAGLTKDAQGKWSWDNDRLKGAAQSLFPNYDTWSNVRGNKVDPETFTNKSINLAKALGPDNAGVLSTAIEDVGDFSKDEQSHNIILKRAKAANDALRLVDPQNADLVDKGLQQSSAAYQKAQLAMRLTQERADRGAQSKATQSDEKRFNDVVDTLQGRKRVGAGAPFQMAQQRLALANAGEKWLEAMRSGKVVANKAAILQLKSNIDQMVSGGSGRSAEMVKALMERTGKGNLADALQFASSKPQSAITKEFIDQYQNELDVEKSAWTQKRDDYLNASVSDLQDVLAKDPSKQRRLEGILKGITPGFKIQSNASSNPQPGNVEDDFKFIDGDPSDPKAWAPQ